MCWILPCHFVKSCILSFTDINWMASDKSLFFGMEKSIDSFLCFDVPLWIWSCSSETGKLLSEFGKSCEMELCCSDFWSVASSVVLKIKGLRAALETDSSLTEFNSISSAFSSLFSWSYFLLKPIILSMK